MSVIWLADQAYRRVDYESEADLEDVIIKVQHRLFGSNRFYLDVKNKIGTKGSIQSSSPLRISQSDDRHSTV